MTSASPPDNESVLAITAPDQGLHDCLAAMRQGAWRFIQLRGRDFDASIIDGDDVDLLGSRESVTELLAAARNWMREGLCHVRVVAARPDKYELTLYSIDGRHTARFDLWTRLTQIDRGRAELTCRLCQSHVSRTSEAIGRLPPVLELCVYIHHLICKRKDLSQPSVQQRLSYYLTVCREAGETDLHSQLLRSAKDHRISAELEDITRQRLVSRLNPPPARRTLATTLCRLRQHCLTGPRRVSLVSVMGCDGAGKTTLANRLSEQCPDHFRIFTGKHLYRKSLTYKLAVIFLRPLMTRSRERFDEILAAPLYLRACLAQRWKAFRSRGPVTLIDRSLIDFLYINRKTDHPSFCRFRWLRHLFGQRIPVVHCHVSDQRLVQRKQEMTPAGHAAYDQDMFLELTGHTPVNYTAFHNDLPEDAAASALQEILYSITNRPRPIINTGSPADEPPSAISERKDVSDDNVSTAAA